MATNRQPDAHIPTSLKDTLIEMKAAEADVVGGDRPTIFVGVIGGEYTEEMWDRHKKRMESLLQVTLPVLSDDIRVSSLGPGSNIVDIEKLQALMTTAITALNNIGTEKVRIVGLGVGSSDAISDAIESLLRSWEIDWKKRVVQFVAVGESKDYHYLNFCKGLCQKKLCGSVQYYNTMDYSPFGYLRSDKAVNESSMSLPELPEMLVQLRAAMADRGRAQHATV